ncbi:MAG: hypothetical protein Q9227_007115 [Pyrenula ochraceoflavens]
MAGHTSVQEAYMLGRGFKESARCWLLELARHKPNSWRLHGLDNSTANFPAKELLPSNVILQRCDVFDSVPKELHGQFDVVHVRAFCVVIKGGDPNPVAANLIKLLKPGGYVQWDEADCASFSAHAPNVETSTAKAAALIKRWQSFSQKSDLKFDWLSDLPGLLCSHGLTALDSIRLPCSDDLRKPSTDNFVMALEEIGRLASNRNPGLLGTPLEWEELFHGLIGDVGCGVTISMDMVVALGQMRK